MSTLAETLDSIPILLIGVILLAAMMAAAVVGYLLRGRRTPPGKNQDEADQKADKDADDGGSEGYIISAVLGLLALLLGFTFALAVDRFESRRALVLQEANAIGTSYLRAQALPDPHRARLSKILVDYTDTRITLATTPRDRMKPLLATNDRLLTDLWSATLAANDSLGNSPFSVSVFSTVNEVIDMDASRKAARKVRVPAEVFLVLGLYIVVAAGLIGYARSKTQGRVLAALLFGLFTMSYMLILDIDRPGVGGITESQGPMEELRATLQQQPPGTFDTWRRAAATPAVAPTP